MQDYNQEKDRNEHKKTHKTRDVKNSRTTQKFKHTNKLYVYRSPQKVEYPTTSTAISLGEANQPTN